jgi:signal peptidase I
MDLIKFLKFSFIFLIGVLLGIILNLYFYYGLENPVFNKLGISDFNNKTAPFDFVKENQIEIYENYVLIRVKNASLGKYAPTGSMIPVLDSDSNGIRIVPQSEEDIHVGDIITFSKENSLIVHRVIDKNIDESGTYFITKGDNNQINDGKIRFKDIKYITIGIIW